MLTSETWLNLSIKDDDVCIEGFHQPLRKDRPDSYVGVAMYIRSDYAFQRRNDLDQDGLEVVWADVWLENFKVLVGSAYRPPNETAEFWKKLEDNFERVFDRNPNTVILCGDLNTDMIRKPNDLTWRLWFIGDK